MTGARTGARTWVVEPRTLRPEPEQLVRQSGPSPAPVRVEEPVLDRRRYPLALLTVDDRIKSLASQHHVSNVLSATAVGKVVGPQAGAAIPAASTEFVQQRFTS